MSLKGFKKFVLNLIKPIWEKNQMCLYFVDAKTFYSQETKICISRFKSTTVNPRYVNAWS